MSRLWIYLFLLCFSVTGFVQVKADYSLDYKSDDSSYNDYDQYEDNRYDSSRKTSTPATEINYELSGMMNTDNKSLSEEIIEEIGEENSQILNKDSNVSKQNNETEGELANKLIEETKSILGEDTQNDFAENERETDSANEDITKKYKNVINETKAILEETHETLDETNIFKENHEENDGYNSLKTGNASKQNTEATTQDRGFMDDLELLSETFKSLQEDDDNSEEANSEHDKLSSFEVDADYEEIDDENLDEIFKDNILPAKTSTESTTYAKVHKVESLPDDTILPIIFNDDLFAIEKENSDKPEATVSYVQTNTASKTKTSTTKADSETRPTESFVDTQNMTESEIDRLLSKFSTENLKKLSLQAKLSTNAQRISLSVDKPTVVTSPEYPKPYPTGSITDWVFEGDGVGIEFNVTDLALNGQLGDYLLIIPGSVSDSDSDGLLFSYTLNTERWYRFLDVDRMFMRFEAKPGRELQRGFSISARMLASSPVMLEPEPEPMPSVRYPEHTITLNLGGITLEGFMAVEEQFRQIVADMATMYINANNIDPGLNSTLDVTQITSRGLCFHNWPKYEMCAEVRFGVPLLYEDGSSSRLNESDLRDMWFTYSTQDPFAMRLRVLGVEEFEVPNDKGIMMVWLVIAGGVVISMAMLAFALWRFSCFEDYTRMPSFSDSDSINEKRKFDMFPTPHQTLPPLYNDADYRWADADEHKVNVEGYSNRNYLREDLFDIESDEEVVPGRNRFASDV